MPQRTRWVWRWAELTGSRHWPRSMLRKLPTPKPATLIAAALAYLFARYRGASPEVLVLAGIAVLLLLQSLQALLQFMAAPEMLQQVFFWLLASLLTAAWTSVRKFCAILAVTLPFILREGWNLTALCLGDGNAASLGQNVDALRCRVLILVALLTAGAVSFTGTISFVGLIAPQVGRAVALSRPR